MINGAIAEPICVPIPIHGNARPVSWAGNHLEITSTEFGIVPDSPIPNKKRMISNDMSPLTTPVSTVKKDHHNTMRMKTARGPILSPHKPEGISNNAYDNANAASTQPNCSLLKPRSALILTPTIEMQILSR